MGRTGGLREGAGLTHRQRQALETRRLIAEAAGRLFLEGGYAATTMDAIAGEAGVAVSTVYAAFKNKRAVLREIRMGWHERTRAREINAEAARQPDPERRLEMVANANRRQWELGAGLIAIYQGAAAADRGRPQSSKRRYAAEGRLWTGWSREWKNRCALTWTRPGLQPSCGPSVARRYTAR